MNLREVKAFVHRNRITEVVDALYDARFRNLTIIDHHGLLGMLETKGQEYSAEVDQKVTSEVKLEMVCEDESRTAEAIALIREHAKTGQPQAGWIYVTEVKTSVEITE